MRDLRLRRLGIEKPLPASTDKVGQRPSIRRGVYIDSTCERAAAPNLSAKILVPQDSKDRSRHGLRIAGLYHQASHFIFQEFLERRLPPWLQ